MSESNSAEWLTRFHAAQEPFIEAWASVIDYHYNGQKGDGNGDYEKALLDVTELLREAGCVEANIAQEVRLCQLVGTMRLYHEWQNPASPGERLPVFLRKRIPPRVTEDMLKAP